MATGFTDFSEFSPGVGDPSGWSTRDWGSTDLVTEVIDAADIDDSIGGRYMRFTTAQDNDIVFTKTSPQVTDVDMLARVRSDGVGNYFLGLGCRVGGSEPTADRNALILSCLHSNQFRYNRYWNNAWNWGGVYNTNESTVSNGNWFWIRGKVDGAEFRWKIWWDHMREPEGWMVVAPLTSVPTEAGAFGLYCQDANSKVTEMDYFAYGTGGDRPPMPVSDGAATVRATNVFAEVLMSTGTIVDKKFINVVINT